MVLVWLIVQVSLLNIRSDELFVIKFEGYNIFGPFNGLNPE